MAETQETYIKINIPGIGAYEVDSATWSGLSDEGKNSLVREITESEQGGVRASDVAAGVGKGTNVGISSFLGSFVDLVDQIPVVLGNLPDPVELGKSALNTWIRLGEHHRGVAPSEMTPKYMARPPGQPHQPDEAEGEQGAVRLPRPKPMPGYDVRQPFSAWAGGTAGPVGGTRSLRKGLADIDMGYERVGDLPVRQRPFARAGEVIGSTLPIAALPHVAAMRGPAMPAMGRPATTPFAPIVEKARLRPREFASQEALATALSATGGGVAERLFPGQQDIRIAAEVAAPFAPAATAVRYLPGGVRGATRAVKTRLGKTGIKSEAAKTLETIIPYSGRQALAEQIRAQPPDTSLTPAQITGDPRLGAMEKYLLEQNPKIAPEYTKRLRETLEANRRDFEDIQKTGDPEALQAAAADRLALFNSVVQANVARAKGMLAAASDKTTLKADAAQLGAASRRILEDARSASLDRERELWGAIPKTDVVDPQETILTWNLVSSKKGPEGLLQGEQLNSDVAAEIRKFERILKRRDLKAAAAAHGKKVRGETEIYSANLLRLRGAIRRAQRDSNMPGDFRRRLDKVVVAIGDDLARDGSLPAAKQAIDFSRNMHRTFDEGEVGRLLSTTKRAQEKVPLESTLRVALHPREKGMVSYRQLREAARFPEPPLGELGGVEMAKLQENFLRQLAGETAGYGGDVNPTRLIDFIRRNQNVISELGLTDRFVDTAKAAAIAQRVTKVAEKNLRGAAQKSFASKIVKRDIDKAIKSALESPNKSLEFRKLADLARRDQTGKAMAGLRRGLVQNLLDIATPSKNLRGGISGNVSASALREILNAPAVPSRLVPRGSSAPTLRDAWINEGILSKNQSENFDILIDKAQKIEDAVKVPGALDDLFEQESALVDLVLRITGANLGGMGAVAGRSGHGLIAAHAGSRWFRSEFGKLPRQKVQAVLVEAMLNPRMMANLLEKGGGAGAQMARQKQLQAFLVSAGIRRPSDEEND